ncbi:MAG: transaldolase family protein [Clostridia bacterium]|nr:transaldolase family protein [Clostridia bacterium]
MNYLNWLSKETQTKWWHDSAIPSEIDTAISNGALGVTTNPVLTYKALQAEPEYWAPQVAEIPKGITGTQRVEALMKIVALDAAKKFEGVFGRTNGEHGYALAQTDPALAGDFAGMLEQGLRYASWGENIAVKVPTTKAALPAIEELAAKGVAVCTTLNFSLSQAIAASAAYERGVIRAKSAGIPRRPCFIVQQGGRLDDYLAEVAKDNGHDIAPEFIQNAGNAVCKRSYRVLQEKGTSAVIMPAGLRGVYHLSVMAGAQMVFSLQTRVQQIVRDADLPQVERMDEPIDESILHELMQIDEFRRAYEPSGLREDDFVKFGVTQRTLSQFFWTGWAPLETYGSEAASSRWF